MLTSLDSVNLYQDFRPVLKAFNKSLKFTKWKFNHGIQIFIVNYVILFFHKKVPKRRFFALNILYCIGEDICCDWKSDKSLNYFTLAKLIPTFFLRFIVLVDMDCTLHTLCLGALSIYAYPFRLYVPHTSWSTFGRPPHVMSPVLYVPCTIYPDRNTSPAHT